MFNLENIATALNFEPFGQGRAQAKLVKLLTHTPEDILDGNHKQLRSGKGNAVQQQTTKFIYMVTLREISRRTDCGTFKILTTQYSQFKNIVLRT